MKQVVLIGDSIRIGYQDIVRRELAGIAEVWSPEINGGDSRNVLAHLDEWSIACKPDVIHINCGLHDLKQAFGASTHQIPREEYAANVRQILERVQRETRAQIIWATTTPVNQVWHHANKEFDRFEADVVAYNETANAIARELKIPLDDLNRVIADAGRDELLLPDGVHYGSEGYALLGKTVADFIARYC
jgi:isoamyl acetate esterase